MKWLKVRGYVTRKLWCGGFLWVGMCFSWGAWASNETGEGVFTAKEVFEKASQKAQTTELALLMRKMSQAKIKSELAMEPLFLQLGGGSFSTGPDQGPYQEFVISQKLPIGPRYRDLRRTQNLRLKLSEMDASQTLIAYHGMVLESILQYQIARLRKHHVEEREQRMRLLNQFLKTRKVVTPASQLDRVLIESRVREVENEIREVRLLYQNTQTRLAQLADLPSDFKLKEELLPFSDWERQILAELEARQRIGSRREIEDQILQSRFSAAKWSWVPDLGVYFLQNEQRPSDFEKTQIMGLQFSFPIWGSSARLDEAEASLRILKIERSQRDSQLDAMANELKMRIEVVRAFEESNSERVLAQMEKSLASATRAFQLGQVTATSLLELEDHAHFIHEKGLQLRAELFSYMVHLAPQLNVNLILGGN